MSYIQSIHNSLWGKARTASFYTLIAVLYFFAESIDMSVTIVRPLYGLYYLLSFFYIYKAHTVARTKLISIIDIMMLWIIIHVVFDIIKVGINPIGSFGNLDFLFWHFTSLAPVYAFYYFGKKGILNGQWFRIVFFAFLVVAFFQNQHTLNAAMDRLTDLTRDDVTNNAAYIWASLFPLLAFFNKKKVWMYSLLVLISVMILLTFKRGAMLIATFSFVFLFFSEWKVSKSSMGRIGLIIVVLVALVFLSNYVMRLFESNDYFNSRVMRTMEGDSSHRNTIFNDYFNFFLEGNLFKITFGHGVLATLRILGLEAHNDWLEYGIDLGLVGLLIYFMYWRELVRLFKSSKFIAVPEIRFALGLFIICYFLKTLFSMSFHDMTFYATSVLGYSVAMMSNNVIRKR